jgi:hypothetical protein
MALLILSNFSLHTHDIVSLLAALFTRLLYYYMVLCPFTHTMLLWKSSPTKKKVLFSFLSYPIYRHPQLVCCKAPLTSFNTLSRLSCFCACKNINLGLSSNQQADAVLESKNMTIEAINEYLKLSDELDKHDLSAKDIDKLLNLLLNAKEYQFDVKKIAGKLRGIQRLEKKEKQLR